MITQSQRVLLDSLKASLFGVEFNFPEDTDWKKVVEEAKAQTVVGLISPILPVNNEDSEFVKATYLRLIYEQDRLVKLFDSINIPFVIIKGFAAAKYYPKPYLREMGDIDILVPRSSFLETSNLLESKDYIYVHGKENDGHISENRREIEYTRNGVSFELHQRFSSPGFDIDKILEDAISRREYHVLNGYSFPVLPSVEEGLVLLGHINQHLKNNGIGLRQILDWEMYLHSIKDKDLWEDSFIPIADRAGLLTLAAYVTRMCNRHLGLPETFSMCYDVNDDLADELLDIVLTEGNFGRREATSTSHDEKRMRGAFYSIKRYGFFKYFTEVGLNKWKLGKNHPVLKPLAFIYGLFRQLGEGIKALFRSKGVGKQMSEGKRRYELYKKLGVKSGEK